MPDAFITSTTFFSDSGTASYYEYEIFQQSLSDNQASTYHLVLLSAAQHESLHEIKNDQPDFAQLSWLDSRPDLKL